MSLLHILACHDKLLKQFHKDCSDFSSIHKVELWLQNNLDLIDEKKQFFFDAIKYIASYPDTIKTYFDGYIFNEELALYTYIIFGYLNNIPKIIPENLKPKSVVFYNRENKYNNLTKLRIFQLAKNLKNNDNLKVDITNSIKHLSNSIVILSKIRFIDTNLIKVRNELICLKNRNNILVFDIIDSFVEKNIFYFLNQREIVDFLNLFDILLCTSYHEKNILSQYINKKLLNVLYHQWDEDLKKDVKNQNNNVYYIGQKKKVDVTCKSMFKKRLINHICDPHSLHIYNCFHFTYVPKNNIYFDTHTSTKLSTAAISKSPLICNKIPVFTELLPPDYPLFIDNYSNNEKIITYCKTIYGGKKHTNLVKMMKSICNRLSPHRIGYDLYIILKPHIYFSKT